MGTLARGTERLLRRPTQLGVVEDAHRGEHGTRPFEQQQVSEGEQWADPGQVQADARAAARDRSQPEAHAESGLVGERWNGGTVANDRVILSEATDVLV